MEDFPTVLIVEDEVNLRTMARLALEAAGMRVLEAGNGPAATDEFSSHSAEVDVIVLDLVMPGMDPAAWVTGVHALRPDLPVLVQTGYPEDEAARRLKGVPGPWVVLEKPFLMAELVKRIRTLV